MVGLRPMVGAERFTRSQCRSRSGATPSNTRAPSNTEEPSQETCERGPIRGGLPSCHAPLNQFQVCECQATCLNPFRSESLPHRIPSRATRQSFLRPSDIKTCDGSHEAG